MMYVRVTITFTTHGGKVGQRAMAALWAKSSDFKPLGPHGYRMTTNDRADDAQHGLASVQLILTEIEQIVNATHDGRGRVSVIVTRMDVKMERGR